MFAIAKSMIQWHGRYGRHGKDAAHILKGESRMKKTSRVLCLALTMALLSGLWIPTIAAGELSFGEIKQTALGSLINFEDEKLNELDSDIKVRFTSTGSYEAASQAEIPATAWGTSINFAIMGASTTIKLPARPAKPSVKADYVKGVFTGLTKAMEYKKDSEEWTAVADTTMAMEEGTFIFRVSVVSGKTPAGIETDSFTISGQAVAPSGLSLDMATEMLKGLVTGQEYSLDNGKTWKAVSKDGDISVTAAFTALKAETSFLIRVKGTSSSVPGKNTSFVVKARTSPVPTEADAFVAISTGKLTVIGTSEAPVEYRLKASSTGSDWVKVSDTQEAIEIPASPAISARFAATMDSGKYVPASLPFTVKIPAANAVPSVTIDLVNMGFKGVTDKMEYKIDGDYTAISGGDITDGLFPFSDGMYSKTVYIRTKADGTKMASADKSFAVPAKGDEIGDGIVTIDFAAETLNGVESTMEYMLPGTTKYTVGNGKSVSLTATLDKMTENGSIKVRKKAVTGGGASAAGADKTLTLTKRADAPAFAVSGTDGTLGTSEEATEYSLDKKTWTDVTDKKFDIAGGKTYWVRIKATSTVVASVMKDYKIGAQPAMPAANVWESDFAGMKFTLGSEYEYDFGSSGTWTAGTGSAADFSTNYTGETAVKVLVRKKGSSETLPSLAREIILPAQASAPKVSISYTTGKITGLTNAMEIKIGDGGSYAAVSDAANYIVSADDYLKDIFVRVAATDAAMASKETKIEKIVLGAAPEALFDADKSLITGVSSQYEYSFNNTYWVSCGTTIDVKHLRPVGDSTSINIYIRKKGTTTAPPSSIQTLVLTGI